MTYEAGMLYRPLHSRGADGRCIECGERFPCPTGVAIYEAVKHELEHPTPRPEPVQPAPPPPPGGTVREDPDDRADYCPQCFHWWVAHGVPGEGGYGCTMRVNSISVFCGCAFAVGNTVTPRQVRIWSDATSNPTPPWQRQPPPGA